MKIQFWPPAFCSLRRGGTRSENRKDFFPKSSFCKISSLYKRLDVFVLHFTILCWYYLRTPALAAPTWRLLGFTGLRLPSSCKLSTTPHRLAWDYCFKKVNYSKDYSQPFQPILARRWQGLLPQVSEEVLGIAGQEL